MNPTDPLANLRDIHLPGDVSWWPLAPGWWALIIIILALSTWGLVKWLRWRKRQVLLHEVQAELDKIQHDFTHHQVIRTLVTDCSQLLRRLVVLRIGREKGANLTGQQWRTYLSEIESAAKPEDSYLDLLSEGQYQRALVLDNPQQFIDWVNNCALSISRQIIAEATDA